MARFFTVAAVVFSMAASTADAQRGLKTIIDLTCAAPVGNGVKTDRVFCDVLIGSTPNESVAITIPPYAGTATLQFDLHNRFTVPAILIPGSLTFSRHEAVVTVIQPGGAVIGRAAVAGEFRGLPDLYDQISGGSNPGGFKAVAPGPGESVRVTVPTGLTAVGIVGARLSVMTRASQDVFDTPGRPVAMVSNVRLQYRPR